MLARLGDCFQAAHKGLHLIWLRADACNFSARPYKEHVTAQNCKMLVYVNTLNCNMPHELACLSVGNLDERLAVQRVRDCLGLGRQVPLAINCVRSARVFDKECVLRQVQHSTDNKRNVKHFTKLYTGISFKLVPLRKTVQNPGELKWTCYVRTQVVCLRRARSRELRGIRVAPRAKHSLQAAGMLPQSECRKHCSLNYATSKA